MEHQLEKIRAICHIIEKRGSYSFEKREIEVNIVRDFQKNMYVHVIEKSCDAESNGRPETMINENIYLLEVPYDTVNEDNWRSYTGYSNAINLKKECYIGTF